MKRLFDRLLGATLWVARNRWTTISSLCCGCGAAGVRVLPCCVVLAGGMALAADETKEVHVYQETLVGGTRTQLSDQTLTTGSDYTTQMAPAISGQIFTYWSISRTQDFTNRDRLGRAKDSVSYHLYESTTLTANYLPEGEDSDGDGIADGWEIYWYGDLSKTASSDTDGDGLTFSEELAAGTNPLMPNESVEGGIVFDDGVKLQYNPDGLQPYTIRCEPEGELFVTESDYIMTGVSKTSGNYSSETTTFAYWTLNGKPLVDRHGRALNQVTFTMGLEAVELVAHCVSDPDERAQYYWYGKKMAMNSDTDGDGLTLAEEIAAGTNPLMPNESVEGGIVWDQGGLLQYNAENMSAYTIRSEPEGQLFATVSNYVLKGTQVTSGIYGTENSTFAYWTLNGVRMADRYGRALNQVTFTMGDEAIDLVAHCVEDADLREQLYWYGKETAMSSDTDGDGLTLAEEIAAGTNPLMANESVEGGIVWDQGEQLETDLQVYEQVRGALVSDAYSELFTSPIAGNVATSRTFANGTQIWPVVADITGDGLWDLIVFGEATTNVFVNVGTRGNPQFREDEELGMRNEEWWRAAISMNSTAKLADMTLDVEPVGALSATTNGSALLVSDIEGHIWYYTSQTSQTFSLQHKVWGGSRSGFANGLRLAAVDWEDDGDLDCLAGTAEGKLMLLRDPKVGRPTNLKADAGVDNVLLTWDPNEQSRIRGYRVYRSLSSLESFESLASPTLPTYRDTGLSVGDYGYKVSALSRFYTAGNSTPTETESVATEPVVATVGGVRFFWNDVVCKVGEAASVMLSIENSLNYDVAGRVQVVSYDAAYLEPVEIIPSGLTEGIKYSHSFADGKWTITLTAGVLPAGSGKFFTLVFRTLKSGETTVGDAKVTITSSPRYQLGDVDGDGDIDVEDLRLLAKLKNGTGRKYNSDQLRAGDFNGNGKLDNADYQALRELLRANGAIL